MNGAYAMSRSRTILCTLFVSLMSLPALCREPRNIVIFLPDYAGYGSVNGYGVEGTLVRTRHIVRISEARMASPMPIHRHSYAHQRATAG